MLIPSPSHLFTASAHRELLPRVGHHSRFWNTAVSKTVKPPAACGFHVGRIRTGNWCINRLHGHSDCGESSGVSNWGVWQRLTVKSLLCCVGQGRPSWVAEVSGCRSQWWNDERPKIRERQVQTCSVCERQEVGAQPELWGPSQDGDARLPGRAAARQWGTR